ncbi:MAG: response regulator transcription factor [Desulfovibrio sp.]|nr:response regulator transcription factor [Desulfovibrio sp.]
MQQHKAKILVVEDDPAILRGLLDVLIFNGYQAVGAEDGVQGEQMALVESFDCVLLDVMLPGKDGFSVCKTLRKKKPGLAIIMLTAKGAENDVVEGFQSGADDYVTKPFSLRELMVRVEAVLRRSGRRMGDERLELGGLVFDGAALELSAEGRPAEPLTRREMEILLYLRRRYPAVVGRQELLRDVWGYPDADIETRTVDIHMTKLRKKIALLAGERQFIATVRGEGYRLDPEIMRDAAGTEA